MTSERHAPAAVDDHGHDHRHDHSHAHDHAHGHHARHAPAHPHHEARTSLLMSSAVHRMALATVLSALLWAAVAWALSGVA